MMTRLRPTLLFAAAALALPLAANAQRIEQTYAVPDDVGIELRNLAGRVQFHSWPQRELRLVALQHTRAVEIHLTESPRRIHIHTHLLQNSVPASERAVDYEIWAPPTANLKINLESGTLLVENFSNDVTVDAVAATVTLRHLTGYTAVKTLNGSVTAERCAGRLEATSISGTLRFLETDTRFLVAETVAGDISYQGSFRHGGDYSFRSHEGTIEMLVPGSASFELHANSTHGEVISELPFKPRTHGRAPRSPGLRSLLGTVNSSDAMVRATSFSGTIHLRKK
ncbi:MAG: DUF4097 domain-containing protein [Terriglobia bacterium]